MALFRIHKVVASLPTMLEADAVYLVRVGTGFDLYVTDSTGGVAHKLNADSDGGSTTPTIADVVGLQDVLDDMLDRIMALEDGGVVTPPAQVAPAFTTQPSLTGSPALGSTITVSLGAASGIPAPTLTGTLTRPGKAAATVLDGATFQIEEADQGGTITLDVTATNSAGSATASAALEVPSAQPAPNTRLAVHIDADIDTVGERDDISAMALWLATQDHFNIVGLTASCPDSNAQEYHNCLDAYATDRPWMLQQGADPALFKPADDLRALVIQGSKRDASAKGYWEPADTNYAAAHAAAQSMIANARNHGDPDTDDPSRKLWVVVQGGYTTLAQAAYEAVVLGELPDFFDRVRVVGQPNWNSSWAPNAWNYLFGNMWPAADDPGLFGNAWMLSGYYQWHAFNRDNGTSDTDFWNRITEGSATGDYLRSTLTRPGGAFTSPHFRAGDAGAWFWMLYAKEQNNYSPENPENPCGVYRTYAGMDPWPSRIMGYGTTAHQDKPNPTGITFSQTHWAPHLHVDRQDGAATFAAVDLAEWYSRVGTVMSLYQGPRVPKRVGTISVTVANGEPTITWDAPEDGGSPITGYVIRMSGEVVATVPASQTSYTFTGTIGADSVATVAAVNELGEGQQSPPENLVPGTTLPLAEWVFDPNALVDGGQTIPDVTGGGLDAVNGSQSTAEQASDGIWTATGLSFDGGRFALVPQSRIQSKLDLQEYLVIAIAKPTEHGSPQQIMARDNGGTTNTTHFQLRLNNGRLGFVERGGGTSEIIEDTVVHPVGEYVLAVGWVRGGVGYLRKNGQPIASRTVTTTAGAINCPLSFGARVANSYSEKFKGEIVYAAVYGAVGEHELAEIENRAREVAASRGITLPPA